MFKWFKKSGSDATEAPEGPLREIDSDTDLDALLNQETVMVFKHSTACPVSWAAHLQVMKFADQHPDFPLRVVPVIQERPASNKIAELTGIRHESPQVILLREGKVISAISHGSITLAQLNQLIAN